jgi:DnaK suppressor protein
MARQETIEKLRTTLLRRRDALARSIRGDMKLLREYHSEASGDILDNAADTAQDEVNSRLLEVESDELRAIEGAIERLKDGTYGTCQECGKPIPVRRLQAVPYVVDCIDCRRLAEKRSEPRAAGWSTPSGPYGYSAN